MSSNYDESRRVRRQALEDALASRILVLDGAMGTMLQQRNLTAADFGGSEWEESVCGGTRSAGGGTQYASGAGDVEAGRGNKRSEEVDCGGGGRFAKGAAGISRSGNKKQELTQRAQRAQRTTEKNCKRKMAT